MGGFFPRYQRRGHMEYSLKEEAPSKRGIVINKMNKIEYNDRSYGSFFHGMFKIYGYSIYFLLMLKRCKKVQW